MKRIIALVLAAVCLFSFAACSSSKPEDTISTRPEIYDMKILSVNGEDITYEFYRYYYLFVKQSYEQSGTEVTEEKIKSDVLNKLLYDAAVHKLLAKYSQSITEEEITECKNYVAMYVSAYGSVFETQLESEMNMTLDVFTTMTINEMAYNKLYTYLAEEKNQKLDFSDDAISEYMKNFKAGMHIIIGVEDEKEDSAKKQLIEKLYKIAELEKAFDPILKLHNLRESLKEANSALEDINKQIADGKASDELTATLKSLADQISSLTSKITEEQAKINVAECLEGYLTKLDVYKTIIKSDIEKAANSNDADILASLDTLETDKLCEKINSKVLSATKEALTKALVELADNKTAYGWFPENFVKAAKEVNTSCTLANINSLLEIYSGNKELKGDSTVSALMERFSALAIVLTPSKSAGDYLSAIKALNGFSKISLDLLENAMLYTASRDAEAVANTLKTYKDNDIYTKLEESYNVLFAPVTTFEELVIAYSDDYEAESGTVVFYLRQQDLLKELQDAVKDLEVGQMTEIVKSSAGYHILKLAEPDLKYFKENEYVYYVIEDMLNAEIPNVEYTEEDTHKTISNSKVDEYEKELKAQKNAISAAGSGSSSTNKDDDNTVVWTVVVIVITVAVVAALVVLIVLASKPTSNAPQKKAPAKKKDKKK